MRKSSSRPRLSQPSGDGSQTVGIFFHTAHFRNLEGGTMINGSRHFLSWILDETSGVGPKTSSREELRPETDRSQTHRQTHSRHSKRRHARLRAHAPRRTPHAARRTPHAARRTPPLTHSLPTHTPSALTHHYTPPPTAPASNVH